MNETDSQKSSSQNSHKNDNQRQKGVSSTNTFHPQKRESDGNVTQNNSIDYNVDDQAQNDIKVKQRYTNKSQQFKGKSNNKLHRNNFFDDQHNIAISQNEMTIDDVDGFGYSKVSEANIIKENVFNTLDNRDRNIFSPIDSSREKIQIQTSLPVTQRALILSQQSQSQNLGEGSLKINKEDNKSQSSINASQKSSSKVSQQSLNQQKEQYAMNRNDLDGQVEQAFSHHSSEKQDEQQLNLSNASDNEINAPQININIKDFFTNEQQRIIFSLEERLLFAGIAKEINNHKAGQDLQSQIQDDAEIESLLPSVPNDQNSDPHHLNQFFQKMFNRNNAELQNELDRLEKDPQHEETHRVAKIANLKQRAKNVEKAKAVLLGVLNDIDEQKINDALAKLKALSKNKTSEEHKKKIIENNRKLLQEVITCADTINKQRVATAKNAEKKEAKKKAKNAYETAQENFQRSENVLSRNGIKQDENEGLNKAEQAVKQETENKNKLLEELKKKKQENTKNFSSTDAQKYRKVKSDLLQAERNLWTEKQKNIEIQKKAIADNINKIKSEIDKTNEVLSFQEHVALKKQLRVVNLDQIEYDTNEINKVEGQILNYEKEIIRINQSLAKSIDPIKKENDNEDPEVSKSTRKKFFNKKYQERENQTTEKRNIPRNVISESLSNIKTADYLQHFIDNLQLNNISTKNQFISDDTAKIKRKIIEAYGKYLDKEKPKVAQNKVRDVSPIQEQINKDEAIQAVRKFLNDTLTDNSYENLAILDLEKLIKNKVNNKILKGQQFTEQQKENYRKTIQYDLYLPYFKNQDVYKRFIDNLANELIRHENFKVQTTNNTGFQNLFVQKKNETKSIGDAIENRIKAMQPDDFIIGGNIKTIAETIKREFQANKLPSNTKTTDKHGALDLVATFIKEKGDLIKKNLYNEIHDLNDAKLEIELDKDDKEERIINDEYNYQHYYKQDENDKILIYRDLGNGEFIEIDRINDKAQKVKKDDILHPDKIDKIKQNIMGVVEYGYMIPFVKGQTYENYIPEFQHYNNLDYPQSDYVDRYIEGIKNQVIDKNDAEKLKIREFLSLNHQNPTYKQFSDKLDEIKKQITDNNILDRIQIGKYRKDGNKKSVDCQKVVNFLKKKFDIQDNINLQPGLQPKDDGSDENVIVKDLVKRFIDKAAKATLEHHADLHNKKEQEAKEAAAKLKKELAAKAAEEAELAKLKEQEAKAQAAKEAEEAELAKLKEQEAKEAAAKLKKELAAKAEVVEPEVVEPEVVDKNVVDGGNAKKEAQEVVEPEVVVDQNVVDGGSGQVNVGIAQQDEAKELAAVAGGNAGGGAPVISQEEAAIKIQSTFRVYQARKQVKTIKKEKAENEKKQLDKHQSDDRADSMGEERERGSGKSNSIQDDAIERMTEEDDVVNDLVYSTYKKYKKYFWKNNTDDGYNSVKQFVEECYNDHTKNKSQDKKNFHDAFADKFITPYKDIENKQCDIIDEVIKEKNEDEFEDAAHYSKYKKPYEKAYNETFRLDQNDIIDRGMKIISANSSIKAIVDNPEGEYTIHPASEVPMDDIRFQEYLDKHFKRFLVQINKDQADIKTNGQLYTFVYYREYFLNNLLKNVYHNCVNKGQDFNTKLNMIIKDLNTMAEQDDLKDKMEKFLGGKLKNALGKKIDKLRKYQDQNSTIERDSQSTDSQSTDSQSDESNLSAASSKNTARLSPSVSKNLLNDTSSIYTNSYHASQNQSIFNGEKQKINNKSISISIDQNRFKNRPKSANDALKNKTNDIQSLRI